MPAPKFPADLAKEVTGNIKALYSATETWRKVAETELKTLDWPEEHDAESVSKLGADLLAVTVAITDKTGAVGKKNWATWSKSLMKMVWGDKCPRVQGKIAALPDWMVAEVDEPVVSGEQLPALRDEVLVFLRSNGVSSVAELEEGTTVAELDAAIAASGLSLGARRMLRLELGRPASRVRPEVFDLDREVVEERPVVPKTPAVEKSKSVADVTARVALIKSRLAQRAKNPTAVFVDQLDAFVERDDWPFLGTPFGDRTAPDYLALVYSSGRAAHYAENWIREHHLQECKGAQQFTFCAYILDLLMLEDEVLLVNSVAVEAIARRMYGLEQVFQECKAAGDYKKKSNWRLLKSYDIALYESRGTRVPAADEGARKLLEKEALLAKWVAKAAKAGD